MQKLACLALVVFTACDAHDAAFDDAAASVEGIYQVTAYTRNEAACTAGGTSLLGNDRFAVAFTQTIFGSRVLTVTSCASAADCREKLADMRANEPVLLDFQFSVNELAADDTLAGLGASTGFEQDGVCTEGSLARTKLELIGTRLQVEQAITIADDYLPDGGFCTTELAQKFAEDNACSQLEVLTAELLEVL